MQASYFLSTSEFSGVIHPTFCLLGQKISSSQVTFIDLKQKKRGRLNAPTDFIYMILKNKGNNIFFDEEGNQTTSPAVDFDKKDNIIFLNRRELYIIYNVSVGKDEIIYQLKDNKKYPFYKINKDDVFMMRNSDGTTTLYNDSYQKQRKQHETTSSNKTFTTSDISTPQALAAINTTAETGQTTMQTNQQLLASNTIEIDFSPAPELTPSQLEIKVNTVNPYTLFRKGSVAEYCFQYKGKQTQWMGTGGPTFLQQTVSDAKIENGVLVAYIKQDLFNKKHESLKGVSALYKDCLFPVEIDTAGTYHLTHNVAQDCFLIAKRHGYGVLIPGQMESGKDLKSSTLYDNAKNLIGGIMKIETVYSNWQVEGEDKITTPAGTFDCIKITGNLAQKQGSNSKFQHEQVTCWMARGIGIVQYETGSTKDKNKEPFIVYLNKIDIK